MKTSKSKISLRKATEVANRFIGLITSHVEKVEISGAIRRQCKEVDIVKLVCIENRENPLSLLFKDGYPGLVTNGTRMKKLIYPNDNIQIELYISNPSDYGRMLALRTGSSAFGHIKLAITWNRQGWCTCEHQLLRKSECEKKGAKWVLKDEFKNNYTRPPVFNTEAEFFEFLKIPWVPPQNRNWTSKHDEINY